MVQKTAQLSGENTPVFQLSLVSKKMFVRTNGKEELVRLNLSKKVSILARLILTGVSKFAE